MEETKDNLITMSKEELKTLLDRLEESNDKQAAYAKKQYHMSQITALASLIVLVVAIYACSVIIPKVSQLYDDMEAVAGNVNEITRELSEAELGQLVSDVDHLVTSSEQSVQEALDQINSIDIETLNQAITDLANLIRPLARFFGK